MGGRGFDSCNNNDNTRPSRGFGQQIQDTPVSTIAHLITAEPLEYFCLFALFLRTKKAAHTDAIYY